MKRKYFKGVDEVNSVSHLDGLICHDPTDLGATIMVAPGQMPGGFLPFPDADCLPFLVKLVPCHVS